MRLPQDVFILLYFSYAFGVRELISVGQGTPKIQSVFRKQLIEILQKYCFVSGILVTPSG
jgi:hypothetical protein